MEPKNLDDKIKEVEEWVEQRIREIQEIPSESFRRILLYSMIEGFAAEWTANIERKKPQHPREEFKGFLKEFAGKYKQYLNLFCPVPLYNYYVYYRKDKFKFGRLNLPEGRILSIGDEELQDEAERFLRLIESEDKDERKNVEKWASVSGLLYQERCKLVHELHMPGMITDFQTNEENPLPHVAQKWYKKENGLQEKKWTLKIPEKFVVNLLKNSIDEYLKKCREIDRDPLEKYYDKEEYELAWHDK